MLRRDMRMKGCAKRKPFQAAQYNIEDGLWPLMCPKTHYADERDLTKAVSAICLNAIKFTEGDFEADFERVDTRPRLLISLCMIAQMLLMLSCRYESAYREAKRHSHQERP